MAKSLKNPFHGKKVLMGRAQWKPPEKESSPQEQNP